jgi:hypothetical protein
MAITTNRDYITKALAKFNVSDDDVDLVLIEVPELNAEGTPDVQACKKAMYKALASIIPLYNVGESGYSISWNMEALKMWYNALCTDLGLPNPLTPKIRNRSNSW